MEKHKPFEVIGHEAAVRPILRHQYPVVGLHPQHRQLGCFNGLGSKGALQAPWLADHFAGALTDETPLDPAVGLHHYERNRLRDVSESGTPTRSVGEGVTPSAESHSKQTPR